MNTNTVRVQVRMRGYGNVARAGRGKAARVAVSTTSPEAAARAAAAMYFRLDACNVQGPSDIVLRVFSAEGPVFIATLPELPARAEKGGGL